MIAPKYINTRLDIEKYNLYVQDLHKKKLKQIKSKCSRNYSVPKIIRRNKNILSDKIKYENKKILNRLIEISKQKIVIRPCTPVVSTLNSRSRLKEIERIDKENKRITSKIKRTNGDVRQEYLEKEFNMSQEYKNRISRSLILKKRNSANSRSERNFTLEKYVKGSKSTINLQ
jgi:hypothetical protein